MQPWPTRCFHEARPCPSDCTGTAAMTNEGNSRRRQQQREAALHQLFEGYGRTDHIPVPQRVLDEHAVREASEPKAPELGTPPLRERLIQAVQQPVGADISQKHT